MPDEKDAAIYIRLPAALKSRSEAVALADGDRSLSSLVRKLLEEACKAHEYRGDKWAAAE
jgi:hypothetical protein